MKMDVNITIKLDNEQMELILGALAMGAMGGHPEDKAAREKKAKK